MIGMISFRLRSLFSILPLALFLVAALGWLPWRAKEELVKMEGIQDTDSTLFCRELNKAFGVRSLEGVRVALFIEGVNEKRFDLTDRDVFFDILGQLRDGKVNVVQSNGDVNIPVFRIHIHSTMKDGIVTYAVDSGLFQLTATTRNKVAFAKTWVSNRSVGQFSQGDAVFILEVIRSTVEEFVEAYRKANKLDPVFEE